MSFTDQADVNAVLTASYSLATNYDDENGKEGVQAATDAIDNAITAFYSASDLKNLGTSKIESAINQVREETVAKVNELEALAVTESVADSIAQTTSALGIVTESCPLASAVFYGIAAVAFIVEEINLAVEKVKGDKDVAYINAIGDHIKNKSDLSAGKTYVDAVDNVNIQASNMGIDQTSTHATLLACCSLIAGSDTHDQGTKVTRDEVVAQLDTLALMNSGKVSDTDRTLFIQRMAQAKEETDDLARAGYIDEAEKAISGIELGVKAVVAVVAAAMAFKRGKDWNKTRNEAMERGGYKAVDEDGNPIEDAAAIGGEEDIAQVSRTSKFLSCSGTIIKGCLVFGATVGTLSDLWATYQTVEAANKLRDQVNTYCDAYIDYYKQIVSEASTTT